MRGAWIEISSVIYFPKNCWSLPVRGAWIEIMLIVALGGAEEVAPRAGSVD